MKTEAVIPKRALLKPAEVCSIAGVQSYILRSWEAEFPALGRAKKKDGARIYLQSDVEMVLQIKELVFGEGLTLGAARRRLDAEREPAAGDDATLWESDLLGADTRQRMESVKKGLQDILKMLSGNGAASINAETETETETGSVAAAGKNMLPAKARSPKTETTSRTTRARKIARTKKTA